MLLFVCYQLDGSTADSAGVAKAWRDAALIVRLAPGPAVRADCAPVAGRPVVFLPAF